MWRRPGAEHRHRVPVGRLDEDRRGRAGDLGGLPAHHAAEADDPGVVGDDEVAGVERAGGAVEGRELLALARPAYDDRALQPVGVVAVDRAAGLEHHVVGDVDGERDGSHPGRGDALDHEVRRRGRRVEAVDPPGHEHRASLGVLDDHGVALVVGRRGVAQRRVAEAARPVDGDQHLAGDAAQGQGVGPVGVDLELDDLLVEAEHRTDVLAGLAGVGRQHDDAVVVLAEAELAGRADHAGGEVAVGLAGADLEAAREHAAGQHRDDEVAGREVVGAADDALRLAGAVGVTDVDGAPVDGLAVLLRLRLHREDPADHQRAGDLAAGADDAPRA